MKTRETPERKACVEPCGALEMVVLEPGMDHDHRQGEDTPVDEDRIDGRPDGPVGREWPWVAAREASTPC